LFSTPSFPAAGKKTAGTKITQISQMKTGAPRGPTTDVRRRRVPGLRIETSHECRLFLESACTGSMIAPLPICGIRVILVQE
jgi:hypothetical protein